MRSHLQNRAKRLIFFSDCAKQSNFSNRKKTMKFRASGGNDGDRFEGIDVVGSIRVMKVRFFGGDLLR